MGLLADQVCVVLGGSEFVAEGVGLSKGGIIICIYVYDTPSRCFWGVYIDLTMRYRSKLFIHK